MSLLPTYRRRDVDTFVSRLNEEPARLICVTGPPSLWQNYARRASPALHLQPASSRSGIARILVIQPPECYGAQQVVLST